MKHKGFVSMHEKAILVSLSYVIGFTTSLIAFALSDEENTVSVPQSTIAAQAAIVEYDRVVSNVELMENEEGLFAVLDGRERILSAKSASATSPGYHTAIISSKVSPNKQYIHYCAAMSDSDGRCSNFVYSVAEDKIYRVKNGEGMVMSENGSQTRWSQDSSLLINGTEVASADSHWRTR